MFIMAEKLECYIYYHEYDWNFERPVLVIQSDRGSVGYGLHPGSGVVESRVCICGPLEDSESCICGGCSEEDEE